MLFILSLIGTVSFVLLFRKAMKKYAVPFYLVATAITVFFLVYRLSGNIQIPDVINKYVMKPLSQGTISTALFSIVMWIGALNRKNPVVKKLFSIRGEMSIIACILTLSHNIYFGIIFFPMLFTSPGSMSTTHFIAVCITLVLIALMIPLMVTSFITIRKKMKFASDGTTRIPSSFMLSCKYNLSSAIRLLVSVTNPSWESATSPISCAINETPQG